MRFSDVEAVKLINIIAKHPVIYDPGHANNRNLLVKEKVWRYIGMKLNKNSKDCKKKWKFMRDCYHRFKKNHDVGSSDAPKNSKDRRHQLLKFLDGVSQHKSRTSNIPSEPQELAENEENLHSDYLCVKEEALVGDNGKIIKEEVLMGESIDTLEFMSCNIANEMENNADKVTETNIEPKEQMANKSIVSSPNYYDSLTLSKLLNRNDDKGQTLLTASVNKKADDVDLFCRHIAVVLQNLPPVQRAEAKKHLSMVLSDYEIVAARNAHATQSSSSLPQCTSSSDIHRASSSSSE